MWRDGGEGGTSGTETTVLLKGRDVIRGRASKYRMWDIINKLSLLKWGL